MSVRKLPALRTVVVKVGSATLGDVAGGLHLPTLYSLAAQLAALKARGLRVLLVSSGAILAGRSVLKLDKKPEQLPVKQACAAIGQIELMARWREALAIHGLVAAQVLLTGEDLEHRGRFLNARNTLLHLLEQGCVPIINENDTVATTEIKVGDNDRLASLTLNLVEAELLVLLSDVDGLYTGNPKQFPDAKRIFEVEGEQNLPTLEEEDGAVGTGGMGTKLEAARRAMLAGTPAVICAGRMKEVLPRLLDGEPLGTYFKPVRRSLSRRKQWLAFAHRPRGFIVIDDGAVKALRERRSSLLPSGVVSLRGTFEEGDLVILEDLHGQEVARGLTHFDARSLDLIKGLKTREIEARLGHRDFDEVVHRDHLVLKSGAGEALG